MMQNLVHQIRGHQYEIVWSNTNEKYGTLAIQMCVICGKKRLTFLNRHGVLHFETPKREIIP